ncbi:hypothetical protein K505DRAFT_340454 [Melanomma pulvis-pyrius CBS 109.77]|uniref:Rhodopsin domain-containing protein n=1 Tax=Melanomma pulvis-pyrius CBS 109.77 TaxID=1314802 RepID=A0A6A6X224_9PLEO|nr:hypothetical protein K505DRAFT_340454 [Melanomma pulvis-pyrius CBS 109.77]
MATGWLGALPPPPGVDANIVNPHSQWHSNIALHTACLTLSTASVAMRLYTRARITRTKLGIDDWFCLLSYFLSITFSGLMIKSYTLGIGRHMWDTPPQWIPHAFKYFTFGQYVYLVLSGTIKLSFLFFYHRIFSPQTMSKLFINVGIVFVCCANTGLLFSTIFSCTPIEHAWNIMVPGHCFDPKILPYLSGGLNTATDLYVLVLPMSLLWGLNLSIARKAKLIAVFGLGAFACIASIVRLAMTPILSSSLDATWNISRIALWAVIEVNVGIICASLTLLPAFLDRHWPKSFSSSLSRFWSYTISRQHSSKPASGTSSKPSQANSGQPGVREVKKSMTSHDFAPLDDMDSVRMYNSNVQKYPESTRTTEMSSVEDVERWAGTEPVTERSDVLGR